MPAKSKSKKPKKPTYEQRLSEARQHYQRAETEGGCVVLKSDYWAVRAERAEAKPAIVLPTVSELPEPVPTVLDELQEQWIAELLYLARLCGFKATWASHQFKKKFGHFPPWGSVETTYPRPTSREVTAFARAQYAEFIKAKKAAETDSGERKGEPKDTGLS
jgi:hypothetical protein